MRLHNKTARTVTLAVLLVGIQINAQTTNTKFTQMLTVKNFYINRIAANAKGVMQAVRFIHTGFVIRSISLLGGPYITIPGVTIGDLITGLALLIYGHKMTYTFTAIKRLKEIFQKHPRVKRSMSNSDWKIFNGGKSVFRGPIINVMHKKAAINDAINEAAASIIQMYPQLAEKKLEQAIKQYFTWKIELKTYEEARKKKQELLQGKKVSIPFIKKAIKLLDKLITAPSVKKSIEKRKKKIHNLFKTHPTLGKIKWVLGYIADTLFQQIKEIREKHSRKFSLFKR